MTCETNPSNPSDSCCCTTICIPCDCKDVCCIKVCISKHGCGCVSNDAPCCGSGEKSS